MDFVHLHNHSYYSILEGLSSPSQLAKRAKELGSIACGLTDKSTMYGCIDFYKACKEQEIRPVIGTEFYIAETNRFDKTQQTGIRKSNIVLIAYNHTGYKNLLQLSTKAHIEGFYYKPRIDHEILNEYKDGLICLSGDIYGEIPKAILRGSKDEEIIDLITKYQNTFGTENFFLEIGHHPDLEEQEILNSKLIEISKSKNIPLVITNNSHYAHKEDMEAHEIILCMQTGKDYEDPSRFTMRNGDYSMRPAEELKEIFPDEEEAFTNTIEIANRCSYDFKFGINLIPAFKIPENEKSEEMYFRSLCYKGLLDRYNIKLEEKELEIMIDKISGKLDKELTQCSPEELKAFAEKSYSIEKKEILGKLNQREKEIVERLEYEMCVINEMGFITYFLIVEDFVNWAKDRGIAVGPGRGSAAGAIVTYALKITDIDPLVYDLLFERFLNPARVSMPDIDMDFEDIRREEIIDYVREKYGHLNVASISTFGTLKAKQAVKDVGRSLGIPYQEMDKIAKKITEKLGTKLSVIVETNPDIKEILKDPLYKKVFDIAIKVEGVVRQVGVHACAIVISEKPLTEYTAIQYPPKEGKTLLTQYSMKPIEMLGLLKMDFLGLRNLTILRIAVEIIKRTKGVEIDLNKIPLDDKKTYELFQRGDTKGVFQFESEGMRKWLKELKADNIEEIIAMVSMYRPGPLAWIPVYIGKKHKLKIQFPSDEGKQNFEKLEELISKFPEIKAILEKTNFIPIYQEQILQIAQVFSGFSLGSADILRRAIGKKIVTELMAQKQKFIDGAVSLGRDAKDAKFLFERGIEPFADYGFNKSHAACYAIISYQTAYLKANFPTEFMTALLQSVEDTTDKLIIQIEDANTMGIEILPPDVNESLVHFTVIKDGQIRFGLNAIKNFGRDSAEIIVDIRKKNGKFEDFESFLKLMPSGLLNKKSIEALALSGAFSSLNIDPKVVSENIDEIIKFAKSKKEQADSGQTDIFGIMTEDSLENSHAHKLNLKPSQPSTKIEKLKWERQYLGFHISGHPLQGLSKYIRKRTKLLGDLNKNDLEKRIEIVGMIGKVKKIMTKAKEFMAYLTLEDVSASISAIVFPKTYKICSELLIEDSFVKIAGRLDLRNGETQIIIQEMKPISLDLLIKNARQENTYDPDEKRNFGIVQINIEKEQEPEEEEDNLDKEALNLLSQNQEGASDSNTTETKQEPKPSEKKDEKTKEKRKRKVKKTDFRINIPEAKAELMMDLKNLITSQKQGEVQAILVYNGQLIKIPYLIEIDDEFKNKVKEILEKYS